MNQEILIFIFLNLYVLFVYCLDDQCSISNDQNCGEISENIYSDSKVKYNAFFEKIINAGKNYKDCASTNCSCLVSVINKDLKPYKENGITKEMINAIRNKGTKYQIINGHLYRDKDCMFPSRCEGIEYFLLKLVVKLPDMEFIINTRDWPQLYIDSAPKIGPVFSFSKTQNYADILYPAWSFWEGGPAISLYPRGLGRWDKHRKNVSMAGEAYPWNEKESKVFFRGSRTSSERDTLVLLSRDQPDFVDAKYTKNQAWKSDADTLHAPPAEEVSFEDHCKYKYLFNFRGVAASFRFKHLFLCKSLVFHVGNEWVEFFYTLLKPWIHYIPVDTNASKDELKHLIEFVKDHDNIAKGIAEAGYRIIWDHLKMEDITCYWNKLLRKYAKLLKYTPERDESLIEIQRKYKV